MFTIEHLGFDYDGNLGKSEPLAFRAMSGLLNEILASKRVRTIYQPELLMKECVGQNFEKTLLKMSRRHRFTLSQKELEKYVRKEVLVVTRYLKTTVTAADGSDEMLKLLFGKDAKQYYKRSVVSSSAKNRVVTCLRATNQLKYFGKDLVFSAAEFGRSKPDPYIYRYALKATHSSAKRTLTTEDAPSGCESARAAGIRVVGYVGALPVEEQAKRAKLLFGSGALAVIRHWRNFVHVLEMIENNVDPAPFFGKLVWDGVYTGME